MNELCFFSNLSSGEWAAWVQAIGSVAAIVAAIWIMHTQHKHSESMFRKAALRQLDSVRAVVLHTALGVKTAIDALANASESEIAPTLKVYDELMASVSAPIQAIPLHELGSFELARRVSEIDRLGQRLAQTITSAQQKLKDGALNIEDLKSAMTIHSAAFLKSKAAFEVAVTALQVELKAS